jgi:hypothetical protein
MTVNHCFHNNIYIMGILDYLFGLKDKILHLKDKILQIDVDL